MASVTRQQKMKILKKSNKKFRKFNKEAKIILFAIKNSITRKQCLFVHQKY